MSTTNQWSIDRTLAVSARLTATDDILTGGESGEVVAISYAGGTTGTFDVHSEAAQGGSVIARTPASSSNAPGDIVFPDGARPRFTNGLSVTGGGTTPSAVIYYIVDA